MLRSHQQILSVEILWQLKLVIVKWIWQGEVIIKVLCLRKVSGEILMPSNFTDFTYVCLYMCVYTYACAFIIATKLIKLEISY